MEPDITIDHIPSGKKRPAFERLPKGICVHNTGNVNSTAKNERDWLTNTQNTTSTAYHYVVDAHDIIECIPPDENAYHAGDGSNGEGNTYYIGIEICESGNFLKNQENAIRLITHLMSKYEWDTSNVKSHKFFSGKYCPRLILPYWEQFIDEIQYEFDKLYSFDKI